MYREHFFHSGSTSVKQIRSRTPDFTQRRSVPPVLKFDIFTDTVHFHIRIIGTGMTFVAIKLFINLTPPFSLFRKLTIYQIRTGNRFQCHQILIHTLCKFFRQITKLNELISGTNSNFGMSTNTGNHTRRSDMGE